MRVQGWMVAAALPLLAACEQSGQARSRYEADAAVSESPLARGVEEAAPSGTLAERLAREASARPDPTVAVEDLLSALAAAGVEVVRAKQVLASPIGARHCTLLTTKGGSGAAVCEFADESAAQRGGRTSHQRFDALIPNRELTVHGNALLTLTARDRGEAERIRAAFERLAPRTVARL